jgi:hypothetical protein
MAWIRKGARRNGSPLLEGEDLPLMAVIEWICDCCGAYLSQWEQHIMVGDEDRCGDCAVHLEHCHEYVLDVSCDRHQDCRRASEVGIEQARAEIADR